jgi:hypothetical protein
MDPLQTYLDEARAARFSWSLHNCALFVAGALDAQYGSQFVSRAREFNIHCAADYRRALRSGKSLEAMMSGVLGAPSCEPARRGDAVIVGTTRGAVAGIAVPPVVIVCDESGTKPLPMSSILKVWRIC